MKIKELFVTSKITEAYFDDDIQEYLENKGYKFIGAGIDQTTWLEPGTGLILKVFGADESKGPGPLKLSYAQKMFKVFADYCMKHDSNKFLPNFLGWTPFKFKGKTYLQIRMERLFPITDDDVSEALAGIGFEAPLSDDYESFLEYHFKRRNVDAGLEKLVLHIGKEGFKQLWMTIYDLSEEAKRKGFSEVSGDAMDLHNDNFMYGSDGHIVINDPYYVG